MIKIGTVRCRFSDLMSYWLTDTGVLGVSEVKGHFVALMLKGAPQIVRAGFETEQERDRVIRKLDKLKKARNF